MGEEVSESTASLRFTALNEEVTRMRGPSPTTDLSQSHLGKSGTCSISGMFELSYCGEEALCPQVGCLST